MFTLNENEETKRVSDQDLFACLPTRSPLWMVTRKPLINDFVSYLNSARHEIETMPEQRFELVFSKKRIEEIHGAFNSMIREGELRLHRLGALVAEQILSQEYELRSVVVGEVPSSKMRFEYSQHICAETLLEETDLDLGNRILSQMTLKGKDNFETPSLVANFVEYQPTRVNPFAIHKIISRIKAEEEIWNKVCDELFKLDDLIVCDKELRRLSRYVKDVFGLKVVVGTPEDARLLQRTLESMCFSGERLKLANVPHEPSSERMEFIEVKDYLGGPESKQSGWEALKSVIRWWDGTFEIQLQPLNNYFREREKLTKESHWAFKASREHVRNRIAERIPLMGFYRDLLKWLFLQPGTKAPAFKQVVVTLEA